MADANAKFPWYSDSIFPEILCKDMNKSFVDYVIQDYAKPMGVATYITSKDMSDELRKALPDVEELRKLLDSHPEE